MGPASASGARRVRRPRQQALGHVSPLDASTSRLPACSISFSAATMRLGLLSWRSAASLLALLACAGLVAAARNLAQTDGVPGDITGVGAVRGGRGAVAPPLPAPALLKRFPAPALQARRWL